MTRWPGVATAAILTGLAGIHVAWGRGSSFPFHSRPELADAVVGAADVPPPAACNAVAAALVTAAALTLDIPVGSAAVRRVGRAGVASVLAARGVLGLAGRTDVMSPGSSSARFRGLDRRVYAPLTLALSAGVVAADRQRRR